MQDTVTGVQTCALPIFLVSSYSLGFVLPIGVLGLF
jgi:hypothetical protein